MMIYSKTHKPKINLNNLSEVYSQDPALAYKLLRFINSGQFPLQERMASIKQGSVNLGEPRVR
ncbi:HDOD domain-containing protein, partial [Pseudoalteromonas ruthenica]|uniref:HDOD domain-containing protein n=1 Tax=Pseudoalteromonas ruthenica TaxID=151081 RepID=UPI00127B0B65